MRFVEIKISDLKKKPIEEIEFILGLRLDVFDRHDSVRMTDKAYAFSQKERNLNECKFYEEKYCYRFKKVTTLQKCKECSINSARPAWPTANGIMHEAAELNAEKIQRQRTVKDYFKAALPVLLAKVAGKSIPLPQIEKRMEVCAECEYITLNDAKEPICGVCSCHLNVKNGSIPDVITLEETALQGCKHKDGSQWKKKGC
jgi:hypothetical protein